MKIVSIFEGKLYAVRWEGHRKHELRRILDQWSDPVYVYAFLKKNADDLPNGRTIEEVAEMIADDGWAIEDTLLELGAADPARLIEFFKPLHNQEYRAVTLSKQKGRIHILRLYAIRISDTCFVITGGAIKLTRLMEERAHTSEELSKLEKCHNYLKDEGVFDDISFLDLINE